MRGIAFAVSVLLVAGACIYVSSGETVRAVRQHYENGNLWREMHIDRNGKLHGLFIELYDDGTTKAETEYLHGYWVHSRHYHRNGHIAQESDGSTTRDWLEDGTEVTPPR